MPTITEYSPENAKYIKDLIRKEHWRFFQALTIEELNTTTSVNVQKYDHNAFINYREIENLACLITRKAYLICFLDWLPETDACSGSKRLIANLKEGLTSKRFAVVPMYQEYLKLKLVFILPLD